jgi:4-hydroxythreonine-4-phosphate dehydrogenase
MAQPRAARSGLQPFKPLVLTLGEFAGLGPELTARAWLKTQNKVREGSASPFVVIGPHCVISAALKAFDPTRKIAAFPADTSVAEAVQVFGEALPVIALKDNTALTADGGLRVPLEVGRPNEAHAPAVIAAIAEATTRVLHNEAAAIVTNPIDKSVLYGAGFTFPGHTEYLAELCQAKTGTPLHPVMLLVAGRLRVALATIHMPLRAVPDCITPDRLTRVAEIVGRALVQDFAKRAPKLAFAGLNPHSGEGGSLGREEIDVINPTAERLRAKGLNISNAVAGDSVFHFAAQGQFDAVIAMYHDQGLAALKTYNFWQGVNVTLGLPIVRTSPDHGTGYAAAVTRSGRVDSLLSAITLAQSMATCRARFLSDAAKRNARP